MLKKIKVLIVDDSALVRQVLRQVLSEDEDIEVIDTASDPHFAVQKINQHIPDVITLDIEMPRMDGLTFLKRIMKQHPIPVVVISAYTSEGSTRSNKAMEYGAIETLLKPDFSDSIAMKESAIKIKEAVKAAGQAKLRKYQKMLVSNRELIPVKSGKKRLAQTKNKDSIILIGASTGGTEAIKNILKDLPADFPAILIVQHMPEGFTESYAKRLNELCAMYVKEAVNGETVNHGKVLIARGNKHMILKKDHKGYFVQLTNGPLINRHRPSVDVLFESAASVAESNAIAVILTGMGKDGAKGMLRLKEKKVLTLAQDEESCVVFGMPKEAIRIGAVDKVLGLQNMAKLLLSAVKPTSNIRKNENKNNH